MDEGAIMRRQITLFGILLLSGIGIGFAGTLPTISVHPQNQVVTPGSTATLSVTASGATGYQWRFNGIELPGATGSALQITDALSEHSGYYMAVVKNETGWVPSDMAYVSVVGEQGYVYFINHIQSAQACYQWGVDSGRPINNRWAQVIAGPALDQMQPIGTAYVGNGYFAATFRTPTVAPGQTVFCRAEIPYAVEEWGGINYTQQSTVLQLVAGGGSYSTPQTTGIKFPLWIEWPDPISFGGKSPTNQVAVTGESVTLSNYFMGYCDLGVPTIQWRKDGKPLGPPERFTATLPTAHTDGFLALTNLQAADAGIYDAVVIGANWLVSPKIRLSVQPIVLRSARTAGSNFVVDMDAPASRNYTVQWSTNLSNWSDLLTLSNATGTVTFSDAAPSEARRFYRAVLSQ